MKVAQSLVGLRPGTVVQVDHGLYRHVGMVSDRYFSGQPGVLSFSAATGGIAEESFEVFARGRCVQIEGYLGIFPSSLVLSRARSMKERRYSWLSFNCEHFVRSAHGVAVESPQVQQWVVLGGCAGVFALALRPSV